MKLPTDYRERVYAGWIGKCAGVRFGAPVENWTEAEIRENLGELDSYLPLPPGKRFKPDDDTSFPMVLIRTIEDFGPEALPAHIRETWLGYLADQRGTLWWGGYGVAGEHTAYLNMKAGMLPPESGSAAMNGPAMAEGIGGQIFSDIWGMVAPSDPALAASYAERFSAVSHAGEGVCGGRYIAALASLAFSGPGKDGVRGLVSGALDQIPGDSGYAGMVRDLLAFHAEHPGDWRGASAYIHDRYGYERYPGGIPIVSNAAVVVMALLYGEGDFHRSLCIATMGGWDTDCNAGNVGAVMGIFTGLRGIPQSWRAPLGDEVVLSGVIGTRNHMDLAACADLIARQGERIAGIPASPRAPRCHFAYPGSTHGFATGGDGAKTVGLGHSSGDDPRGLRVAVKKFGKKSMVSWHIDTSLSDRELSANYYGASFSPRLYPGQTLRSSLWIPADAPRGLVAGIYCTDRNRGVPGADPGVEPRESARGSILRAPGVALRPGTSTPLEFRLPRIENGHVVEAGVELRTTGQELWNGRVVMEWFDWDGPADYSCDFSRERSDSGAVSQWTFHSGFWRLEGKTLAGSGAEGAEAYTGDIDWEDYEVAARIRPLLGTRHLLLARVRSARRSCGFGFDGPGRLRLVAKDRGETRILAGADYPWEPGREYELALRVSGTQLSALVDGIPLLGHSLGEGTLPGGQIGLATGAGGSLRCSRMDVRP